MGKYVQWLTHKDVRILFLNGRGLPEATYIAALGEMRQELLKDRSSPPVLIDLSNTAMTSAIAAKAKSLADDTRSAGIPDGPCAVVGLSKLAKVVAKLFGRGARFFDGIEEAREWLVKEAGRR